MIDMQRIKHVLISRTNNIGDVVLIFPLAVQLKRRYPHVKITFLVRDYTMDVVRLCPAIDQVLSWDQLSRMPMKQAKAFMAAQAIDCVIHVYAKSKIAKFMRHVGIPHRIGSTRYLYHWLTCNRFVHFSSARVHTHEVVLNLKYLAPLGITVDDDSYEALVDLMQLKSRGELPERLRSYLHPTKFNLIIHPFTNGHTREWPVSQFTALIRQLPTSHFHILVTGSTKEAPQINQRIMAQCPEVVNVAGLCSLAELSELIAHADGLVANSTGPVHLAAALGIHTLGLFPASQDVNPVRWEPIGVKAEYLMADPNCQSPRCRLHHDCLCMESITVDQVKAVLMRWLA